MVLRNTLLSLFLFLVIAETFARDSNDRVSKFSMPASFVENRGQVVDQFGHANKEVLYLFSQNRFNLQIRRSGFSFELFGNSPSSLSLSESEMEEDEMDEEQTDFIRSSRVDVSLVNANPDPMIMAEEPTGVFNYYINVLPAPGFEYTPGFRKLTMSNVYAGIDLVFYLQEDSKQSVKYEFIVHAGADANQIRMEYKGAGAFFKNKSDHWISSSPYGIIDESPWLCYLKESGDQVSPHIKYEGNTVRFKTPVYKVETLVLDPQVLWGTYFGGAGLEDINAETAVDKDGNVILIGTTFSNANIASSGSYQTTYAGGGDVFLTKFEPDGTFLWATYLGGNKKDQGYSVTVNDNKHIFVCGQTMSSSGIATNGAFQHDLKGATDILLAKFSASGTLKWSTYYGGSKDEFARGVCTDENEDVYITGQSKSPGGFTTADAYQHSYGGKGDCYLSKFTPSGELLWSTYLGGSKSDRAHGVYVRDGIVYIIGTTESLTGIATPAVHQTELAGYDDLLLAKFNASTGNIFWCTYYGGKLSDHGRSVRVDGEGNIYVTGFTNSFQGIATPGSYQPEFTLPAEPPGNDAILARFTADGQLAWGTYYGGDRNDVFYSIELSDSFLYAAGLSTSTTGVTTPGSYQDSISLGDQAGLLVKMDVSGNRIWATYMGQGDDANIQDMALFDNDLLYLAIFTAGDYLVSSDAYQPAYNGDHDYLIYKFFGEQNCLDLFEPNNKKTDAKLLTPIHVSDEFLPVLATVSDPLDTEWFSFVTTAGEPNIAVVLSSLSQDYNIELRNASGSVIDKTEDGGINSDTLVANNLAEATYLIKVAHEISFDPLDCYQLTVYSNAIPFEERQFVISSSSSVVSTIIGSPNPASSFLNVRVSQIPNTKGEIRLSSLSGKNLYSKNVIAGDGEIIESISLQDIPSGVYVVQWLQPGIFLQMKVVVIPH